MDTGQWRSVVAWLHGVLGFKGKQNSSVLNFFSLIPTFFYWQPSESHIWAGPEANTCSGMNANLTFEIFANLSLLSMHTQTLPSILHQDKQEATSEFKDAFPAREKTFEESANHS